MNARKRAGNPAFFTLEQAEFHQDRDVFVDALHAGPELEDLAQSMQRSRAKDLAHDVGRKSELTQKLELRLDPHA